MGSLVMAAAPGEPRQSAQPAWGSRVFPGPDFILDNKLVFNDRP